MSSRDNVHTTEGNYHRSPPVLNLRQMEVEVCCTMIASSPYCPKGSDIWKS